MGLAKSILSNEKVMGELGKMYAQGRMNRFRDSDIRNEMVYFLEQNCGVFDRPASITKALISIWDKIQESAQNFGYDGPIIPVTKGDDIPEYLVRVAEKFRSSERVLRSLGYDWYHYQRNKSHLVRGAMMSKDYYGSYPNTILAYAPEIGVHVSFKEAKMIAKYLKRDILRYGKMVAAEEEKKENITEAICERILKKIKLYG